MNHCFACGHTHDPASPGTCWEAACLPNCPEHADGKPFAYSPRGDDLDRAEEVGAVPVEVGGPGYDLDAGYRYLCIRDLRCSLTLDTHTHACHRANDEARREFYADILDDEVAEHEERRRRGVRVTASTALGRSALLWVDQVTP